MCGSYKKLNIAADRPSPKIGTFFHPSHRTSSQSEKDATRTILNKLPFIYDLRKSLGAPYSNKFSRRWPLLVVIGWMSERKGAWQCIPCRNGTVYIPSVGFPVAYSSKTGSSKIRLHSEMYDTPGMYILYFLVTVLCRASLVCHLHEHASPPVTSHTRKNSFPTDLIRHT